jgi:hypothetical protein
MVELIQSWHQNEECLESSSTKTPTFSPHDTGYVNKTNLLGGCQCRLQADLGDLPESEHQGHRWYRILLTGQHLI